MYDKVFQQAESFFKPMSEIFELNAETIDSLRVKQADLMNEMLNDGIEFAKGLSTPSFDMESMLETQTAYWEGVRTKLTNNAQDSYELISDAQGKVGELLQGIYETNGEVLSKTAKPAAKKKAPAKKAAPKAKTETAVEAEVSEPEA